VNDDFRDPIDAAIAHDLKALAPGDLDADAALGALRPALVRARARRRLAVTGGAIGAIALVLGVGGVLTGGHSSHVNVQQRSTTLPATASTPSTPTTRKPALTPTPTGQSVSTTPAPSVTSATSPAPEHHGGTSTPAPGSTTKPPTTPPPSTHTYRSAGGSITITFAHGALTLDSYAPALGYRAEVHTNDPSDVEVRFSNANTEWRIRIRVENGRLQPAEITNN